MKTGAIVAIVVVAVLVVGAIAWAGGYSRYGYGCGSRGGYYRFGSTQNAPVRVAPRNGAAYHNHQCGHWWGRLAPWHRDRYACCWDQCW